MKANELISVIVPYYNSEKHLKKCVDSITKQSYPHLEIILVNDGSFDGSRDIAQKLAREDGRIKLIDIEHSGVSVARNTGLSKATGFFVMFVDSDDMVNVNIIGRMLKVMMKTDVDMVSCQIDYTAVLRQRPVAENIEYRIYTREEYLRLFFKINSNQQVHYPVAKLYKHELLPENMYPPGIRVGEDVIGTYLAVSLIERIAVLKDVGYYYYENPDSATGSFSEKDFDLLKVWDRMVEITRGKEPDHEFAHLGRDRINFTLLLRMITQVPSDVIKRKYSRQQKRLLRDLRRCEKRLVGAPIVGSRKLMIMLMSKLYGPMARVGDIYVKLRSKIR